MNKSIRNILYLVNKYNKNHSKKFIYKGMFFDLKHSNKNKIDTGYIYIKNYKSFKKYLKDILKKDIIYKLNYWSKIMNLEYSKVYIRSSKYVWGSCSSKRNLNFSIRLISIPDNILDYIIIHELSHLLYFNHNKKFWNHVSKYYPNYKRARDILIIYQFLIFKNKIWNNIFRI
ncbi:zinc metalloprotease [Nanobdella aerobiophila]|uniref:Zinc metalloprotease n=1 Tax=Nanobdella aerobiophila TaxID=2586965 RepID=A0A915SCN8_9ARCH|nr:M48 family metallopeptidase [Nanobdella aerobiophila]BBL45553.1 zinc metalloprotease [Nanobdella aerobiophila]